MRITLHQAQIAALLTSPGGAVVRHVNTYTRRTVNCARTSAPADTGAGRASIRSDLIVRGDKVVGRIFMAKHMIYQHQGTGVYAGRGPIRPRTGKYLVFRPKDSKKLVYAKQVKGVPPKPFLYDCARAMIPWPVRRTN